jgi:hypothetical protein
MKVYFVNNGLAPVPPIVFGGDELAQGRAYLSLGLQT